MNSQLKDVLNDFISSNSSAIEQTMHSANHGKDEPVIQDLVNYLSCPTPQQCHEDGQAMSGVDKALTPNGCEREDGSHYSPEQMCGPASTSSHTVGSPGQQYHQISSSYEQNSLYPDSFKQNICTNNSFQDMHLGNASMCDRSRDQENNGDESSLKVGLNESHYFQTPVNFHCPSDVDGHYRRTIENQLSQFSSTENGGQFQNNSQANGSHFKETSSSSADSPQAHYSSGQQSLGYGLMDVAPAGNLETSASQLKAQEKMNVDEPEGIFNPANGATSSSQLDAVLAGFVQAHMHSYNSVSFSAQSTVDSAQGTNATAMNCGFTQSLSADSPSDSCSDSASNGTIISPPAADRSRTAYQQSPLPSPFLSHNFQQSPPEPIPSSAESSPPSDIEAQSSSGQVSSVNSNSTQYNSWQSASFSVSASSSPYQNSPVASHIPAQLLDSFPDSFKMSSTAQTFSQEHQQTFEPSLYQRPQSCHQPVLLEQFQQSPAVRSDYNSEVTQTDYSNEVASVRSDYSNDIASVRSDYSNDIASVRSYYSNDIASVRSDYSNDIASVRSDYSNDITSVRSDYSNDITSVRSDYSNDITSVRSDYSNDITSVRSDYSNGNTSVRSDYGSNVTSVRSDYGSNVTSVQSPDQPSGGYIPSVSSSMNACSTFSPSLPAGDLCQQSYLTVSKPSPRLDDASNLIDYSPSERSTLAADYASANQACATQAMTGYLDSSSSDHTQVDSSQLPSDVTMGDSQSREKFSQLVFNVETSTSISSPSTSSGLSTVSGPPPDYDGYTYSSLPSVSITQPTNTAADASTQFSFNQQSQAMASINSYRPTLAMDSFVPGCDQSTAHQFGAPTFSLHSASHTTNESYPQPMQVQQSDLPSKAADFERATRNTETAMEITSSLMDKSANLQLSCMSFEEIHMSIVKAGNVLSNDLHRQSGHSHVPSDTLHSSLTGQAEALSHLSGIHPGPTTDIYQTELAGPHCSKPLTEAADTRAHQDSLNTNGATLYSLSNSDSAGSPFSSVKSDHRLISAALHMSHTPSSHFLLQEHLDKQPGMTVPNFLDTPRSLTCGSVSDLDNVTFMSATDMPQSHLQTQNGEAMTVPSSNGSSTVVADTGINQPIPVEVTIVSDSSSQRTILNLGVTSAARVNTLPWPSNASFVSGSGVRIDEHTSMSLNTRTFSQAMAAMSPKLTETSDSRSAGEVFLQSTPESSSSDLPNNSALQGPKPNSTASLPKEQPQIVVSLEDLQKLLAQQNISHSSLHQQQPHSAALSPQTLILQKHGLHLRQSQPRLLIRGASLLSSSRLAHPHQQMQQPRDRLQFMAHRPPDHVSTGTLFQRSPGQEHVRTTQEEIPQEFACSPQLSSGDRDQHKSLQQTTTIGPPRFQPQTSTMDQHSQPRFQLQNPEQQTSTMEHDSQPRFELQNQEKQQQTVNLFLRQISNPSEQKDTPLHPFSHQQLNGQLTNERQCNHETYPQEGIQVAQVQQELQQLQRQQGKEQEDHQLKQFRSQVVETQERTDTASSDSLKKEYKHLHSLLTRDTTGLASHQPATQANILPAGLNLPCGPQGQSSLQLLNRLSANCTDSVHPVLAGPQTLAAPFTFTPLNSFATPQQTSSSLTQPGAPLTTLAFVKTPTTCTLSKSLDTSQGQLDTVSTNPQHNLWHTQSPVKLENGSEMAEQDLSEDGFSNRPTSILAQILTERKRCHTPLSVDANSTANSSSEAGSPLSSPIMFEDGYTQLTLIERSAGLQIKSDTVHSVDDDNDDEENAVFDLNSFHKRPSVNELHSGREDMTSVPIKIAKPSMHTDAHSCASTPMSPESKFDFGGAVTTTSHFFHFGQKEDNNSEVYTFGAATCDSLQDKDGSKHYRPSFSKAKAVGLRSVVHASQPAARSTSRKQKDYSLKAYYPSKVGSMELKIVEQPEPQHRARYQTEGSRGAIKDTSQQGFPVIKLSGYNRATKLQVFIGDECSRVKPHGFYQACRVLGKSSTFCTEQELDGTTLVEVEMLPENDMTVKLDCIGILKLRNADVERRIGPKRARDKKRTNIRARLVMRCGVEKSDGSQHLLQVVSNPIVCTQPVGQPEISRMSLTESAASGGESLFIIGKNFRNKGTSVYFQKVDASDDSLLLWQAEAEIEQEFFQPTHLICKVPPYKDPTIDSSLVAQVVVSCAGKNSEPLGFLYKPVYPVAPSMKKETRHESDMVVSTRPMAFVSPEALHLNRLVQQSQSSTTTSSMFQLPPGTIPGMHSATPTCAVTAMHSATPPCAVTAMHTDPTPTQTEMSSPNLPAASSLSMAPGGQPSFLLEEKRDSLVQMLCKPTAHCPASLSNGIRTNSNGHSGSKINAVSSTSFDASESQPQPSSTTSSSAGHTSSTETPSSASSSFPSTPFFVVVDPAAMPTSVGGDKIQQLLMQILEAQSKCW